MIKYSSSSPLRVYVEMININMSDLELNKRMIDELYLWTWWSILVPSLILFGGVISWTLGLTSEPQMFIIITTSLVVGFGIIWWWVIKVIKNIVTTWFVTQNEIQKLIDEIKEVRDLIEQAQERAGLVYEEVNKKGDIDV